MSNAPVRQQSRERFERRRQEIADIAAQVFADRGYHYASVSDLVEATGLKRGGLYHYISGKQELLVLIHQRFMEPLLEESRAGLSSSKSPEAAVRVMAHILLDIVERYRNQVTVFLREWRNISDEDAWSNIIDTRHEYERMVLQVLKEGEDQGAFSITDHKMAMMSFLGMINYTYQWFDTEGSVSVGELADQMSSIFLYGVTENPHN